MLVASDPPSVHFSWDIAMTTLPARLAYVIAAAAGAVGWLGISQLTHRREAWDSALYFSWRWAFTPFAAQAVVAFVQNPGANLLPLGLLVFAFYGALCLVPAWVGAALRHRLDPPRPTSPEAT
jgi:hypothetical protein